MAILVSALTFTLCALAFSIGAVWGSQQERARVIGMRLSEWVGPDEAQDVAANEA